MSSSGLNKNHAPTDGCTYCKHSWWAWRQVGKSYYGNESWKLSFWLASKFEHDNFDIEQLGHDMQTQLDETNREPRKDDCNKYWNNLPIGVSFQWHDFIKYHIDPVTLDVMYCECIWCFCIKLMISTLYQPTSELGKCIHYPSGYC